MSRRVSASARSVRAAANGEGGNSVDGGNGSVRRRGFGLPSLVRRRQEGHRLRKPWEVTREEWDQAISHALF